MKEIERVDFKGVIIAAATTIGAMIGIGLFSDRMRKKKHGSGQLSKGGTGRDEEDVKCRR